MNIYIDRFVKHLLSITSWMNLRHHSKEKTSEPTPAGLDDFLVKIRRNAHRLR